MLQKGQKRFANLKTMFIKIMASQSDTCSHRIGRLEIGDVFRLTWHTMKAVDMMVSEAFLGLTGTSLSAIFITCFRMSCLPTLRL